MWTEKKEEAKNYVLFLLRIEKGNLSQKTMLFFADKQNDEIGK